MTEGENDYPLSHTARAPAPLTRGAKTPSKTRVILSGGAAVVEESASLVGVGTLDDPK